MNHLEERKAIQGVVLNDSCSFNHLLFVDDILISTEDNDIYLNNLQIAIKMFQLTYGLKINDAKSTISSINVTTKRIKIVSDQWGIV